MTQEALREQYQRLDDRWQELSEAMLQPEILSDLPRYQRILKDRAALEPAIRAWEAYREHTRQYADAVAMCEDPELASMAEDEAKALRAQLAEEERQLQVYLLPRDPDDDRNVVLEIRAGAGGEEACLFGAMLLRMYTRYAERHGFRAELLDLSDTELGGVKEAVMSITGNGVWSRLKYESGVHRIQRVPITESNGKIQTSTCTVAVLPEAEEVDLTISPDDLRIDTYRATGHGGQYINKTDSAVRITHLPTGVVVTCQDQKSQLKNKEQAMKVLRSRLMERMRAEQHDTVAAQRRGQVGTGDRSERIRSANFREGRVTDHRLGLTLYRIDDIFDGDLDPFIDALRQQEQNEKLGQL